MKNTTGLIIGKELERIRNSCGALLEEISDGIAITDNDGNYVYSSTRNAKILGFERGSDLVGLNAFDFFAKDYQKQAYINREITIKDSILENMFFKLQRFDGEIVPILLSVAVLNDRMGCQIGYLGLIRDLSNISNVSGASSSMNSDISSIFDQLSDGLFMVNKNGSIVALNSLAELIHTRHKAHIESHICSVNESKKHISFHDNSNENVFEMRKLATGDNKKTIFVLIRDVTMEKYIEVKLEETYSQMQLLQRINLVGQMSAGIAHDINNLLQVIVGYTTLISEEISCNTKASRYLDHVIAASRSAGTMIRQLLTLGREGVHNSTVVNLTELSKILVDMMKRTFGESYNILLVAEEDVFVLCDKTKLEQVLMNLSINARDSMPDGGTIELHIKISNPEEDKDLTSLAKEPCVEIVIKDHGCGIQECVLDKIFDPFFTTKDIGKGTGLGLAMVKNIVEEYGGSIGVDSVPNKGTAFRIFLPIGPNKLENIKDKENDSLARCEKKDYKLLLIGICKEEQDIISGIFGVCDEYITVDGADEALEFVKNNPGVADLCVLDIGNLGVLGSEIVFLLRTVSPDMPIAVLSDGSDSNLKDAIDKQPDMISITRPIGKDKLLLTIKELLKGE